MLLVPCPEVPALHKQALRGYLQAGSVVIRVYRIPQPTLRHTRGAYRASATPEDVIRLTERIRSATSLPQRPSKANKSSGRASTWHLNDSELLAFERKGHLLIRRLVPVDHVKNLAQEVWAQVLEGKLDSLRHRIRVLCPEVQQGQLQSVKNTKDATDLLRRKGTEPVGFLQVFNTWRRREVVWQTANRLAGVAATLMGCKSVRLYQDCAFLKEPGYAETNWHSDLRMSPLDTNDFVTAWIPLRHLKAAQDSSLIFASGSHRDFALPFWHSLESMDLKSRGYTISRQEDMALGDVSWHNGWTVHAAPPQSPGSFPRLALSISFFKDGARLLPKQAGGKVDTEDMESYQEWHKDLNPGSLAKHKLLPLLGSGKSWPSDAA